MSTIEEQRQLTCASDSVFRFRLHSKFPANRKLSVFYALSVESCDLSKGIGGMFPRKKMRNDAFESVF